VQQVNQLTGQIASLNQQIVNATGGGSGATQRLLDQRDATCRSFRNWSTSRPSFSPTAASTFISAPKRSSQDTNQPEPDGGDHRQQQRPKRLRIPIIRTVPPPTSPAAALGGLFQSQQLIDTTTDSVNSLAVQSDHDR
jgi:hypothetical protein